MPNEITCILSHTLNKASTVSNTPEKLPSKLSNGSGDEESKNLPQTKCEGTTVKQKPEESGSDEEYQSASEFLDTCKESDQSFYTPKASKELTNLKDEIPEVSNAASCEKLQMKEVGGTSLETGIQAVENSGDGATISLNSAPPGEGSSITCRVY